jgi:hypothetical protein
MYEVAVRGIPARSLLTLLRYVQADEQIPVGRKFFIERMRGGSVPSPEGIGGAPFMIYHGELTEDSDCPVEWCWPVPGDQAAAIAAGFPDLTLRTEPAHQEAFIHLAQQRPAGAEWQVVGEAIPQLPAARTSTLPSRCDEGIAASRSPVRVPGRAIRETEWTGEQRTGLALVRAGQMIEACLAYR